MTPNEGTDTVRTLEAEAAVSSLAERATAAEARAEQAEGLAKRAEHALEVEQDRARQAEQERDAERSRAEGLWALLEAAQLQLAEQRAQMTDQALARALKAAQEANALHQAEAARRSKGRWARLKVAWRGE
jgi:hypothetical protein